MNSFTRILFAWLVAVPLLSQAQSFVYPATFKQRTIDANGVSVHVRSGGFGPAIVLLQG